VLERASRGQDDLNGAQPSITPPARAKRTGRSTPKRPQAETAGMADIFPYYAGFSFNWASSILNEQIAESGIESPLVLDPWNGSGTTTAAAQYNGYRSVGVDFNPVANIVANLRVSFQQRTQTDRPFVPAELDNSAVDDEPLSIWLDAATAGRIRSWVRSAENEDTITSAQTLIAIFRVVREITKDFEGSNPTWVKKTRKSGELVHLESAEIDRLIIAAQRYIIKRLNEHGEMLHHEVESRIITASAKDLPLSDGSVNVILTSPPYLTRIDYAVSYSRELAVMGINAFEDRRFRGGLMGTALIRKDSDTPTCWGPVATELVERIAGHSSKASSGYYKKQVTQYLDDLTRSFDELSRVAAQNAILILVVQDSYYKEIPVGLAAICTDEAQKRGWSLAWDDPERVKRSITQFNSAAWAYPKGDVNETIISLRRIV
jgi:hypothetical protein